jgi:biopolymer transport protein ExbD
MPDAKAGAAAGPKMGKPAKSNEQPPKKKKLKEPPACKINMTPMIDIVFQLLLFFMLAMELSRMELESVALPYALKAVDDKGEEGQRIIINIDKEGRIRHMRRTLTSEQLQAVLKAAAERAPRDADRLPVISVKVRGDADTEYKYVQDVMVQCMRAFIWRMSFGVSPVDREAALNY